MTRWEYMSLGHDRTACEIGGQVADWSLHEELTAQQAPEVRPGAVTAILNTLGASGWELVSLDFPYVFKRLHGGTEWR